MKKPDFWIVANQLYEGNKEKIEVFVETANWVWKDYVESNPAPDFDVLITRFEQGLKKLERHEKILTDLINVFANGLPGRNKK